MFGFIVGTLSLIGFVKVWRGGRHGRGGPRRWMMRRLFEHLDTTPGQEKAVSAAVEQAERTVWQAREQVYRSRTAYAKAMRAEPFDTAAVNEAFEAQQAAVDEVKKSVREGMQSVHEALTAEQRARLADLIEFGPGRLHGCGGRGRFDHHGHQPSAAHA